MGANGQFEKNQGAQCRRDVGNRTFRALLCAGFTIGEAFETAKLDEEKLYQAVFDGSIWGVRDVGHRSVKKICGILADSRPDLVESELFMASREARLHRNKPRFPGLICRDGGGQEINQSEIGSIESE